MQSRAERKARHAMYRQDEHATLRLLVAEQNQQIRDLRRLVSFMRRRMDAMTAVLTLRQLVKVEAATADDAVDPHLSARGTDDGPRASSSEALSSSVCSQEKPPS